MPTCKKCGNSFPNRVVINGQYKKLQCRKYCLECSPYNKHNTKQIHNEDRLERTCLTCGRNYLYNRGKGHKKAKCNSCYSNGRKTIIKEKLVTFKGGRCELCGYDKCIFALEFHHKISGEKDMTISGNHGRAFEVLKAEVEKCLLLCANCHRELHAQQKIS